MDAATETILIVEDDAGVAMLERRRLERAGFSVQWAESADQALDVLRKQRVALILLDYRLPGDIDGLDFYSRVRNAGFDVPVILVTGFGNEATVIQALRVGVRDFVTKSSEYLEYLPEAVARVLRQVRMEKQLVDSEARLSSIINSAKDAILVVNGDSRITSFNPAAAQMFQCAAAKALGENVSRFLPLQLPGVSVTQFVGAGIRQQQGESFPLEASISVKDGAEGLIYTIVARDITERQRFEERLREQAALLDKANDAIIVLGLSDQIQYWNEGAGRLYGWTSSEAMGRGAEELLNRIPNREWHEALHAVQEQGEWVGELRQVTKQNKDVLVSSRWTLVRDGEGRPRAKLVLNTDISEKKKLETQVLRSQRLESLGVLAGGIAHDLNNVLTPMMMAVDIIRMKMTDPDGMGILDTLRVSCERGADLVKQILAFARGSRGERQILHVRPLMHEICRLLQQTLPKSITVVEQYAANLWIVSAEATQVHQVLMNLCINARDAMPQGGQLLLAAENFTMQSNAALLHPDAQAGPHVLLTVEDTGTGIQPDILDKVFDPFFTTKEVGYGTGLGLSTALGIVKSHGGFMNVYSEVGRGTRFHVYLPAIVQAGRTDATSALASFPAGRGELVLLVDDENSIRQIAQAILETNGYRVLTAKTGKQALELHVEHGERIDLVITDMAMAGMDGPATIQALRAQGAKMPVVAASGFYAGGAWRHGSEEVRKFLDKPYTAENLLKALHEILHGAP